MAKQSNETREFNCQGCFIVLLAFFMNLLWGCVYKGMGVLLPALRDQFTTHTWIIGIMVSMMAVTVDIVGLLTMPLENRFGSRRLSVFTTLMVSVGLMLVPLATNVVHIAITLVLLVGPGLGIICVLPRVLLGRQFSKHYALVCGISLWGIPVSLVAFAPMMQLFLDTYGWRGATLLMAGICMHAVAAAAVVRVSKPQYQPVQDQSDIENRSDIENSDETVSSAKSYCVRLYKAVDLKILLEFNFWIVYTSFCGGFCTFTSWTVYYIPHLQVKGFSPQVAAALCSAAALGYFVGTVICPPVVDRGLLKCSTAILISSLTLTLSFVVDPWVNDVVGMAVITFLYGLATSSVHIFGEVLTKELFGTDRLTSAFAWVQAFGFLPRILAGFFPGWIYDSTGSYDLAFIVIGLTPTVVLLPLVIGILRKTV